MSPSRVTVGQVRPRPGRIVRGHLDVLAHPLGHPERLPLIVARGRRRGPTLVVSANIHGNELTGLHVLHDLVTPALAKAMRGTLIALPSLNPTGLAVSRRQTTFDPRDPNRLFPNPQPRPRAERQRTLDAVAAPPAHFRTESAMHAVYDFIVRHADVYLDLHTATFWSLPLTFVDPVFFGAQKQRPPAKRLHNRTLELARAVGLTIVREEPPPRYLNRNMHRTSTGSVLNGARIPALTLELGMSNAVDPVMHAAGLRGVRNVMRHLDMLPGEPEPQADVPVLSLTGHMRGIDHPRAAAAGVVHYHVRPGDAVRTGRRIATIRHLNGRTARGGIIRAAMDGVMLWLRGESVTYPGTPLGVFGVEDDLPMVLPWPKT